MSEKKNEKKIVYPVGEEKIFTSLQEQDFYQMKEENNRRFAELERKFNMLAAVQDRHGKSFSIFLDEIDPLMKAFAEIRRIVLLFRLFK